MAFWSEMKRHYANFKVAVRQKGWKVYKDGTRAYFGMGAGHPKWAGLQTPPEGGPAVMRPDGRDEYWKDGILERIVDTSSSSSSGTACTRLFKTRQAFAPDAQYQGMKLPDTDFYDYYAHLYLEGTYYRDGTRVRPLGQGYQEVRSQDGTISVLLNKILHSPDAQTPARQTKDGTRQWFDTGVLKKQIDPSGQITTFIWNSTDTRVLYKEVIPPDKKGVRYLYDAFGALAAMSYPDGTRIPLSLSGPISGYTGIYEVNALHLFSGMSYLLSPDMRMTRVFNQFGKTVALQEHDPTTQRLLKKMIFDRFGKGHDLVRMTAEATEAAGLFIQEALHDDGPSFPYAALSSADELHRAKPYTRRRYLYAQKSGHIKQALDCAARVARLQHALGDELLDAGVRLYGLDRIVNWRGSLSSTGILATAAARSKGPKPSAG